MVYHDTYHVLCPATCPVIHPVCALIPALLYTPFVPYNVHIYYLYWALISNQNFAPLRPAPPPPAPFVLPYQATFFSHWGIVFICREDIFNVHCKVV